MTTTRYTVETIDPRSVDANRAQRGELDDDNVSSLVALIARGVVLDPAVVVDGEVKDGCHRRAAALAAGVGLRAVVISRSEYDELREDAGDDELTDIICARLRAQSAR